MKDYKFLGFVKTEFGVKTGVALMARDINGRTRAFLLIADGDKLRELVLDLDTAMLAELLSRIEKENEESEEGRDFKEVDAGVV